VIKEATALREFSSNIKDTFLWVVSPAKAQFHVIFCKLKECKQGTQLDGGLVSFKDLNF
jgi:hypothetical protein